MVMMQAVCKTCGFLVVASEAELVQLNWRDLEGSPDHKTGLCPSCQSGASAPTPRPALRLTKKA
jgi:hypothetical protein